jgi:hypothetical protein
MVGAALKQPHPKFAFQPLDLLAQRRLHDVLSVGGPPKVQFFGEGHEVAKLTYSSPAAPHLSTCPCRRNDPRSPLPQTPAWRRSLRRSDVALMDVAPSMILA